MILIAPDHSIPVQDIWPIPNTNAIINPLEANGVTENPCPPPMTAAFTSDVVEICKNGTVNYSDLSTGNITEWTWTFEGGVPETSDEQNPAITYPVSGTYDVSLTVSDGTNTADITMEDYLYVDPCTGVHVNSLELSKLYPNPVTDLLNIELYIDGNVHVEIVNMVGQVVFVADYSSENGMIRESIDLNSYNEGFYFVRLQTEKEIKVSKIMLNK